MSKQILDLYKKARINPPDGKNIHSVKFHRCVVDVLLKIRKGELPAGSSAHAICMSSIGRDKAVKKSHQR